MNLKLHGPCWAFPGSWNVQLNKFRFITRVRLNKFRFIERVWLMLIVWENQAWIQNCMVHVGPFCGPPSFHKFSNDLFWLLTMCGELYWMASLTWIHQGVTCLHEVFSGKYSITIFSQLVLYSVFGDCPGYQFDVFFDLFCWCWCDWKSTNAS